MESKNESSAATFSTYLALPWLAEVECFMKHAVWLPFLHIDYNICLSGSGPKRRNFIESVKLVTLYNPAFLLQVQITTIDPPWYYIGKANEIMVAVLSSIQLSTWSNVIKMMDLGKILGHHVYKPYCMETFLWKHCYGNIGSPKATVYNSPPSEASRPRENT